jgi:DNA-binding CsgD family transcriptional regulator
MMRLVSAHNAPAPAAAPESGEVPRASFSPRETDCLRLLVQGFTDEEIAGRLAITHATVRFHLDSARRKATARSRTHLAALAVLWGVARP